ncbi:MAG: hypothetical protein ACXADL_00050 [Candidatus Thorarchaeota archaeon]
MASVPLHRNTVTLSTLALIAALGMIVRMTVRIPVVPELVEITPAFLFSELGGIIGGLPGGIVVGFIVGIGGAMGGGEISLIPFLGNIFLGIGTGYAVHITKERDSLKYSIMVILGGGIIGGWLPDMTIFLYLSESIEAAFLIAIIDMIQAFVWAAVALLVERRIIRPIAGHYLYPDGTIQTLHESEV